MRASPRRLFLVHAPTPIERRAALDEIVGAKVWIKRDELARGAEVIITCGGLQSNHARATALVCARLGLRAVLYLRVADPAKAAEEQDLTGNVLLDRLAGAEIVYISPAEYRERGAIMEHARRELEAEGAPAYVVPEGGSNGLGSLGYVEAMREVRGQLDLGLCEGIASAGGSPARFDVVAHACGSGGTAAGVALGAARFDVATEAWAFAVCDDRAYFETVISRIAAEASGFDPSLPPFALAEPGAGTRSDGAPTRLVIDDRAKGPAYGVMDPEQKRFLAEVARRTGLVLDPVYSGKALFGVAEAVRRGDIDPNATVLFIHTGGLPGLLAQGEGLREALLGR